MAQSVEHAAVNRRVVGSNPTCTAKEFVAISDHTAKKADSLPELDQGRVSMGKTLSCVSVISFISFEKRDLIVPSGARKAYTASCGCRAAVRDTVIERLRSRYSINYYRKGANNMANKKNFWYVIVMTDYGAVFVTAVDNAKRRAEWDKNKVPMELTEYWAKDLAQGLTANMYLSYPVCVPCKLGGQPYRYTDGKFKWVEKEDKDE